MAAITNTLAPYPPERGGAILSFGETSHLLIQDDFGVYTPGSWLISDQLSRAVGVMERENRGTLAGTVHTHPDGVVDPSGQDISTTAKAMAMNPHLDSLLICVVTRGRTRQTDVRIGNSHRMSIHTLSRNPDGTLCLQRALGTSVPLGRDLAEADLAADFTLTVSDVLKRDFGGRMIPPVIRVSGRPTLVVPTNEPGSGAAVLFDPLFPLVPPLLARVASGGIVAAVPFPWDSTRLPGPQLAEMKKQSVRTVRVEADTAGSGESRVARVRELTGALNNKHVVVAGAGSVGSRIAEDLVRSGVLRVTVIDPDEVSTPNMARSVYVSSDIGRPKVDALAERLGAINPGATVTGVRATLREADLERLLTGTDLVVMATDDMAEQAYLAHWAYWLGIPQVASAMFRKGAAGEIVLAVPEAGTPCWSCCAGVGTDAAAQLPPTNYGIDGRLVSESALGPSINAVTSVASQVAIGVLAGPSTPAGEPLIRLVSEHRTLGLIATTPKWGILADLFPGMNHQFQPQSAWPVVHAEPACPVCGPSQYRIAPALFVEESTAQSASLAQSLVHQTAAFDPWEALTRLDEQEERGQQARQENGVGELPAENRAQ